MMLMRWPVPAKDLASPSSCFCVQKHVTAADVQRIAQTFFEPKQIALTILGNLDNFRIGREELTC